jgi:hypothetical protein
MPLYSLEWIRSRYYRIEVEAESLADARAKAEAMPVLEILGAHDCDGEIEVDGVHLIDEDGNPIEEVGPFDHPLRVGADEIAAAWNETLTTPEFVQ